MGRSSTRSSSSFRCGGRRGYPVEPGDSQKKHLQSTHHKYADEKLRTESKFNEKHFAEDKKRVNDFRSNKMALPRGSRDDKKTESKQMLYSSKPTKEYDNNNSPKKKWSEKEIEELIFKYKKNDKYESARKKNHFDKRHTYQDTRTNYDSLSYRGNVLFSSENDPRGVYFDRGASAATMAGTIAATTAGGTTAADGDKVDDYAGVSLSSRRRHDLRDSPSRVYYHRVSEHTDYCKRDSIISDLSCASGLLPSTCREDYDREESATRGGRDTIWRDSHRCTSLNSDDNRGDLAADYSKCYKKRLSGNVIGDSRRKGMDHMNQSGKSTHLGNKNGEEIDLTGEYSDEESKEKKMYHNYSKDKKNLYGTFFNLTSKYEKVKNKKGDSHKEGFKLDEADVRSRIKSCNGDQVRQNKLIRDPLRSDNTFSSHFYKSRDSNFDKISALFDTDRKKKKYADVADIENYVKGFDVKRSRFSRRDSNHKGERLFKGSPCFDDILKHSSDDSCSYEVCPVRKGPKEGIRGSSWGDREGGKTTKSLRGSPIKPFSPLHTLEKKSLRGSVTKRGKNSPTNVRLGEKTNPFNIDDTKVHSNHFKNTQLHGSPRSHASNDCSTLYDYVNYAKRGTRGYCDSDVHLNSSPRGYYPSGVNDVCAKSRDRFSSLLRKIQTKKNYKNDDPNFSHVKSTTWRRGSYLDGDDEMFPLHSYATKNTHFEKSRGGHNGRSSCPPNGRSGDGKDESYGGKFRTGELPKDVQKQCLRNSWREKKQIKNLLSYVCDEGGGERDEFLRNIGKKYLFTEGEELLNSILNLKKMKSSRQVGGDADEGGYDGDGPKECYEKERKANYHSWKYNPDGKSSKGNMGETVSFQYLKNRSYTRPMHVGDFDVGDAQAADCANGVDDRDCADLYDHGYSGEYGEEHSGEHIGERTDKEQGNPSRQGSSYCRDVLFLLFLYLLKILYYLVRYLVQLALLIMVYFYHVMRTKSLATIFISVVVAVPLFLLLLSVLILSYRSVNTEFFDRDI
ncbi:hypothetical protein PCYB_134110 [Plasmodium cynomolgi strain B]|uniref:Uncharacterized protein n=1 Tax=Plasmodium cynomolgi (strain B) TaxID=1120755 RepID=K6VGT7_PLACD|nr:hypothetical protein PCYB_134110 [Plasmodium cynomolgi strain B]GAB68537.1 hypothetical protein PCYB_134110 [Plasmodium cynomolgi strain B]